MRDSEVVAAIVAGNPEGLAEAYDRYASPLYTYCRSLLREPADAADAVQDTFVIAASRLAELRDRNRLRPWLYAVARNECHRRLRARTAQVTTPLDEMPDVTDTSADVSGEAERDELRTLLRSAVRGLNPGEQDLIELQLRQGLDAAEIAAVLGVSRNHAHALLSRARDQLEISLGALLVARSGQQDCAALNTMLADWDGQLNVLMRKRINRHIENCPACTERKKRELAPALLLGLAPLAALPTAAVPPGLREQVLRLASSNTPDAAAHRASVAQRTAPFGHHGFPKPLDPPKSSWWRTRSGQAAAAAAAAAAIAALTLLAVALASSGPGHPGGGAAALGPGAGPGTSIAAASGTAGGPGSGAPASGRSGGGSSNHPQPTVSANGAANVSSTPGAGGAPAPGGGGQLKCEAEFACPLHQQRHGDRQFVAEPGHPDRDAYHGPARPERRHADPEGLVRLGQLVHRRVLEPGRPGHGIADGRRASLRAEHHGLAERRQPAGRPARGRTGRWRRGRGRVHGLHAHREPGQHHGHGRAGDQRGQQFQPAAVQSAAVQPAAVQSAAGRRAARRTRGPASELSRCA